MKPNELTDKLKQLGIEKTYKYYSDKYNKTKKEKFLLYKTLLELKFFPILKIEDNQLYSNLIQLSNSSSNKIVKAVLIPCIAFSLEYENYAQCFYLAQKGFSLDIFTYWTYISYVLGLIHFKKDYKNPIIETYLLKAEEDLKNYENSSLLEQNLILILVKYYSTISNKEKIEELSNKITLTCSDQAFIDTINALIEIVENKNNYDHFIVNKILSQDLKFSFSFLIDLFDIYYFKDEYYSAFKVLEYAYKLQKENNNQDIYFIKRKMIECLLQDSFKKEAIELLKEEDLNKNSDANYLLAEIYADNNYLTDINKAIRHFTKANSIQNSPINLIDLGNLYIRIHDKQKADDIYQELKSNYKANTKLTDFYINKAIFDQDFDLAFKLAYSFYKKTKTKDFKFINYMIMSTKSYHFLKKAYKLIDFNENEFTYTFYLYNGTPFTKPNYDLLNKTILKILEDKKYSDFNNEQLAFLANTFLDIDNSKYIKILNYGHNKFINLEDGISTCSTFLAYSYYYGIGVEQDIKKANTICNKIEKLAGIHGDEYYLILKSQINLDNKTDLENTFNLLSNSFTSRYQLNKLLLLIKIGELLNKDVAKYKKQYKKGLKFCSIKEKDYFKNNPSHIKLFY